MTKDDPYGERLSSNASTNPMTISRMPPGCLLVLDVSEQYEAMQLPPERHGPTRYQPILSTRKEYSCRLHS